MTTATREPKRKRSYGACSKTWGKTNQLRTKTGREGEMQNETMRNRTGTRPSSHRP
jgi:hypothetical protein